MILDPGISTSSNYSSYTELIASGAYVRTPDGQPMIGIVWPGTTVFPDFLNPAGIDYWFTQLLAYHSTGPEFDGLWIGM